MKTDRLIGIITILQQRKCVTAPWLAHHFEVSRRTINRDIEDICKAGIPIVTTRGAGGGISIMEGFSLDTTVFTTEELQSILIGLKSIGSVSRTAFSEKLLNKFTKDASTIPLADSIRIDLSSFYKGSLTEKVELLKTAIKEKSIVSFHYYYGKGEADKRIEPYQIVFKWAAWYLFGYCMDSRDFRMYKLNRLWDLQMEEESFVKREIPALKQDFDAHIKDDYMVTAIYEPEVKYRLVEEYGPECFTVLKDGRLYTRWGFNSEDSAFLWLLGFGSRVEVTEPECIRRRLAQEAQRVAEKYK